MALAAALDADACEIYSDVAGVFSADPRLVPTARRLAEISYEEMQELAEAGARVLNAQAVEFAKDRGIAIYARATAGSDAETVIRRFPPRAPGRVAGVASETGLILIEHSLADERTLLRSSRGSRRSSSGWQADDLLRSLGRSPPNVPRRVAREPPRLGVREGTDRGTFPRRAPIREGLGAVSAIGAGINQTFTNLKAAVDVARARDAPLLGVSTSSFRIHSRRGRERMFVRSSLALHERLVPTTETHPGTPTGD